MKQTSHNTGERRAADQADMVHQMTKLWMSSPIGNLPMKVRGPGGVVACWKSIGEMALLGTPDQSNHMMIYGAMNSRCWRRTPQVPTIFHAEKTDLAVVRSPEKLLSGVDNHCCLKLFQIHKLVQYERCFHAPQHQQLYPIQFEPKLMMRQSFDPA
jgi:hypothetical protein